MDDDNFTAVRAAAHDAPGGERRGSGLQSHECGERGEKEAFHVSNLHAPTCHEIPPWCNDLLWPASRLGAAGSLVVPRLGDDGADLAMPHRHPAR